MRKRGALYAVLLGGAFFPLGSEIYNLLRVRTKLNLNRDSQLKF